MTHGPAGPSGPSSCIPHPSSLPDWRLFAAAAGAALAATTSTAEASIIYGQVISGVFATGVNVRDQVGLPFFTNGNNPQTANVSHQQRGLNTEQGAANLANNNLVGFAGNGNGLLLRFGSGQAVQVARNGTSHELQAATNFHNALGPATVHGGNFANGVTGFVGFEALKSGTAKFYKINTRKFTSSGNQYTSSTRTKTKSAKFKPGDLGWLRVEVGDSTKGYPDALHLIDMAFNDVPGAAINAGQEMPQGVPEPGTKALLLLAAGSAGVLAWRKARRNAAPTQAQAAV